MMMKNPSCGEVQCETEPSTSCHDLTGDKSDDWLEWKQENTVMMKKPSCGVYRRQKSKNNTESHSRSKNQTMQTGKMATGKNARFKARAEAQIG